MNKIVVIIRHAKSSWANPGQSDYERPLNERGRKDAPEMGKRIKKAGIKPDKVYASTAKRVEMTAQALLPEIGFDLEKVTWDKSIYHCPVSKFEDLIVSTEDRINTIFLMGHNETVTDFVNKSIDNFSTDNVPTCGVVAFAFDGDWSDFHSEPKKLLFYDFPKNNDNA